MRRLGLVALVACLAAIVAGATAPHAHAFQRDPNAPIFIKPDVDYWTVVDDVQRTPPNASPALDWTERARRAGRRLPKLSTLGNIALAGGAFSVGWKIGGLPGGAIYRELTGSDYGDGGAVLGTIEVVGATSMRYSTGWIASKYDPNEAYADTISGNTWRLFFLVENNGSYYTETAEAPDCNDADAGPVWNSCGAGKIGGPMYDAMLEATAAPNSIMVSLDPATHGCYDGTYPSGNCVPKVAVFATETVVERQATVTTAAPWVAQPVTHTTNVTHIAPTSGDRTAVNNVLAPAAEPSTAGQDEAEDWTNTELDPVYVPPVPEEVVPSCAGLTVAACNTALDDAGFTGPRTTVTAPIGAQVLTYPPGAVVSTDPASGAEVSVTTAIELQTNADPLPIELPQPGANETYTEYLARLQALGYVGTSTVTVLDPTDVDTALGPHAVVTIRLPGLTYVSSKLWPLPWPRQYPDDDMELYVNPPNVQPAPEPLPEPGSTPPPVSANCDGYVQADLDLSPLTDLDFGDVFPFGMFGYAFDVLAQLDVSPIAPAFEFEFPELGGHAVTGGGVYNVSLDFFSGYMSTLRTIFSVVLWIGGVWLLATTLLGFRATGDVGAAIDDGTPF